MNRLSGLTKDEPEVIANSCLHTDSCRLEPVMPCQRRSHLRPPPSIQSVRSRARDAAGALPEHPPSASSASRSRRLDSAKTHRRDELGRPTGLCYPLGPVRDEPHKPTDATIEAIAAYATDGHFLN
jgi:hypothetical protein